MAPNAGKVKLLRCVIREDLSMGMVDNLVADLRRIVDTLDKVFVFTDKEVRSAAPHHACTQHMQLATPAPSSEGDLLDKVFRHCMYQPYTNRDTLR